MSVGWQDLTKPEQEALKRLDRGYNLALTKTMSDRLKELGLAEQKLGGTGISRLGRELLKSRR